MDVIDALKGIVCRRKAMGQENEWLSSANMAVLGKMPPATAADSSAAAPAKSVAAQEAPPPVRSTAQDEQVMQRSAAPAQSRQLVAERLTPSRTMQPMAEAAAVKPSQDSFPPPPDVTNDGWDELVGHCLSCRCCGLCSTRTNVVVEDGCRQAELMFIGEGPGGDEDAQGVPFVGRAGQLLTKMIAAMGRNRSADAMPNEAVYIANIVKCRPPGNRNPEPEEANACIGYLKRQIKLVRPNVIVLLGGVPLGALMGLNGITRRRGQWLEYDGIPVMPTFHPAYLLRFERFPAQFLQNKRLVWQDLQAVMARLATGG